MGLNTSRHSELNKTMTQVRHGVGSLLALVIFWIVMLALLSFPIWLPAIVEQMIH